MASPRELLLASTAGPGSLRQSLPQSHPEPLLLPLEVGDGAAEEAPIHRDATVPAPSLSTLWAQDAARPNSVLPVLQCSALAVTSDRLGVAATSPVRAPHGSSGPSTRRACTPTATGSPSPLALGPATLPVAPRWLTDRTLQVRATARSPRRPRAVIMMMLPSLTTVLPIIAVIVVACSTQAWAATFVVNATTGRCVVPQAGIMISPPGPSCSPGHSGCH
jgi:hypothetical protein